MYIYKLLKEKGSGPGLLGVQVFREISKYTESSNQLEVLDLSLNFLSTQDTIPIIAALPPQIKELNLSFNRLKELGID